MNVMNKKWRATREIDYTLDRYSTEPKSKIRWHNIFGAPNCMCPISITRRCGLPKRISKWTLHIALNTAAPSPSSASPTTTVDTPPATPPTTSSSTGGIVLLARLGFRCIVHQKGVQRQSIRQDEVPNIISSNGKSVQRLWFTVPSREFYGLEMRIHLHVNTYMDNA